LHELCEFVGVSASVRVNDFVLPEKNKRGDASDGEVGDEVMRADIYFKNTHLTRVLLCELSDSWLHLFTRRAKVAGEKQNDYLIARFRKSDLHIGRCVQYKECLGVHECVCVLLIKRFI
jgi:hypothetical protein